jgi:ankyrin repeat protein
MIFEEIHHLIKHGNVIALRRELDNGLDPNLSNKLSWSLLMLVALEGNTQLGELLISRGADINRRNKFGDTALSLAAHKGFLSFMQLLLDRGASSRGVSRSWLMVASGLPKERIVAILHLIRNHKKSKSPSIFGRCINTFMKLIRGDEKKEDSKKT